MVLTIVLLTSAKQLTYPIDRRIEQVPQMRIGIEI